MAQIGIGPFPEDDHDRLGRAAVVFAAGVPAVGFVSVLLIDGEAHIDQLSVVPERGGHGIGRDLLDEAIDWARAMRCRGSRWRRSGTCRGTRRSTGGSGSRLSPTCLPGSAPCAAGERDSGLDAMGPRVAMRLAL